MVSNRTLMVKKSSKIEPNSIKAKNSLKQRHHVTVAVNAKIDEAVFCDFLKNGK